MWCSAVIVVNSDLVKGTAAIIRCGDANDIGSGCKVDTALQQPIVWIEIEASHRHAVVQYLDLIVINLTTERCVQGKSGLLNGCVIRASVHDLHSWQLAGNLLNLKRLCFTAAVICCSKRKDIDAGH